jgi:hypothetical protein
MRAWIGLTLAFASALVTNMAYSLEHDAAAALPPFAPLALVQAVGASGVAVLAFATARGHPSRLARREQLAVVLAVAGLVLLALSLGGAPTSEHRPPVVGVVIWLAACGAALGRR